MYETASGKLATESGAGVYYQSAAAGSKTVNGSQYNDVFSSFLGSTLIGGKGDDTYFLWDSTSKVNELANEGVDTVKSYIWGTTVLADNVENLYLIGQGASGAIGNALNNILVAGDYSATLNGGAGDDVLVGGKGADVFQIQAGNGSDAIVGFQSGRDAVELNGYKFASFAQLKAAATQVGADTSISLGNDETLVLRDVALASLTGADFGFSAVGAAATAGRSSISGPASYASSNGAALLNNTWGVGNMKCGVDYTIGATYDAKNVSSGVTFNWSFPNSTDPFRTVKAYPEIIFGSSPFSGSSTWSDSGHSFPVKVADIGSLSATFNSAISGNTSGFNVAFDIFLTSKAFGDASTITNEVMIWTHKPDTDAPGKLIGTFNDGVHSGSIYHDGTYTAVVLDNDMMTGTLDISAVLATLQKLGVVASSEYLASVQFGSEVLNGTGSLSINDFALDLRTTDEEGNVVVKSITGAGTTVTEMMPAAKSYAAVTAKMDSVTDGHGLLTGYKTVATTSPTTVTTTLYDTRGQATGSDAATTAGSTITTEHYDAAHKLLGLDVQTTPKAGTVTTKHYDAAHKLVGSDTVVTTATSQVTSHYDKSGALTGTDSTTISGVSEVTEHYNAKWQRTGAEVTWHYGNGTVVVGHANANWQTTGYDEYSSAGGVAKVRHFDAANVLTGGTETHVDAGGVTIQSDYDKTWTLLDTVYKGTTGDDVITLKSGVNAVHGGLGSDVFAAGSGTDTFYFDTAIGKDVDKIIGFTASRDALVLDHSVFAGLGSSGVLASSAFTIGSAAQSAATRVIYDDKSGDLYFDADGTGSKAAVLFAHVDPHLALTSANFHLA